MLRKSRQGVATHSYCSPASTHRWLEKQDIRNVESSPCPLGVSQSAHVDPWSLMNIASPLFASITSMVCGAFTFLLVTRDTNVHARGKVHEELGM